MVDSAPDTAPALSIIIVSYNTREMTIECIRSVFRETVDTTFEVLVVDNHSHDGSADAILQEFGDQVHLIDSEENLGFALANNVAAKHARGRMLLLLNPDTVVINRAVDELMRFAAEHSSAQLWGGRTIYADGSLNPTSCWHRLTLWTLTCSLLGLTRLFPSSEWLNPECYGRWQRDTARHVDIVTGCFLLLPRTLWDQLDGFDSKFFMYGEEADLCLRAHALGARPILTPSATIIHHGSASDPDRAEKTVAVFRGKISLIRRHFSRGTTHLAVVLFAAAPAVKAASYSLMQRLSGRPSHRKAAAMWREVWRCRQQWLPGYTTARSDRCDV